MTSEPRLRIASLLDTLRSGSFAARRTAGAEDLKLSIEGIGPLQFPIAATTARQLQAVSQPARYGQREHTLLDQRVRDTGEIPADRIEIDQNAWDKTLDSELVALGHDLGLASGQRLTARLHALLVYGPGQFFKPHQDSQRADTMVGTLVVTLPSKFTGGAIVVEHQGEVASFRAGKQPLTFVAFYADCRHEVRPVKTGYRIVLTYDLMLAGDAPLAPAATNSIVAPLVAPLVAALREHFDTPRPALGYGPKANQPQDPARRLVYLLDYQYTEAGLGWRHLKGSDGVRAAALVAAAETADCEVVLALAEVQETWQCEDPEDRPRFGRYRGWRRDDNDDWLEDEPDPVLDPDDYALGELIDSTITLDAWLECDGQAAEKISTLVRDYELSFTTPSSALKPTAAEYEGYMGNYGNTMDRWYRRAAIVLWPRTQAFAVRAEVAPQAALATLVARLAAGRVDECRNLVTTLLSSWPELVGRSQTEDLATSTLQIAFGLADPELALALLQPFQLQVFGPDRAGDLAVLVECYGESWMAGLVRGFVELVLADRTFGSRDAFLAWMATLNRLCSSLSQHGRAGRCVGRHIVEQSWRALAGKIASFRDFQQPSLRESSLDKISEPLLGWLDAAALIHETRTGDDSGRSALESGLEFLRVEENAVLGLFLIRLLRLAAQRVPRDRQASLGLPLLAKHCRLGLLTRLAAPARVDGDWSIVLPAGCTCELCQKFGAFLGSRSEQRLEWPLAEARRQHIERRINHHELPVRHEIRRKGSPYVLVLEKSKSLFTHEAATRRAWQDDLDWLADLEKGLAS